MLCTHELVEGFVDAITRTAPALKMRDHKVWVNCVECVLRSAALVRREMAPHSDLDLLLIHPEGIEPDVKELCHPLRDSGYRIDYVVRTPRECARVISVNSTAALALPEMRHFSG